MAGVTRPTADYVDRILETMDQHPREELREHWWTGAARTLGDEVVALRADLEAIWEDVAMLLDQHVSPEVELEARQRLIERFKELLG